MSAPNYVKLLAEIRYINNAQQGFIPLHAPVFEGREKEYLLDVIDSTFVSSVGEYVDRFEAMLCELTGAKYAIACVNGTAALEMCLILAGVKANDLVLTQSASFVATANAVAHLGAEPVFIDIERLGLGLCPRAVRTFLENECKIVAGICLHKRSGQSVTACVPMHTLGLPCQMTDLVAVCAEWHIPLVEDAAEAVGSLFEGRHCGTLGKLGALSFNGNKIITTGGGGAILSNNDELGKLAKHLTTTAKMPHKWAYRHDYIAWNFRMPNINAALGCAQLESLSKYIREKRMRAQAYAELFANSDWTFVIEPKYAHSNYWLCAVLTNSREERDDFLEISNKEGIMTRPLWEPLHTLPMYAKCLRGELKNTLHIADRLVNLPSGICSFTKD